MKAKKQKSLVSVVLVIILGILAGAAGSILSRSYLTESFNFPYLDSVLDLENLNYQRAGLVIQGAKNIVVSQEVKIEETLNNLEPSLFSIFPKAKLKNELNSTTTDIVTTNINDIDAIYYLNDAEITALALTKDGWLLALIPTELNFNIQDFIVIDSNHKIYEISRFSFLDRTSGGMALIKLAEADNLEIKRIASNQDLFLGQTVLVLNNKKKLFNNSISAIKKPQYVSSSDRPELVLELNKNLDEDFANSFIFNLAGDLLAVVHEDLSISPSYLYNQHWQSIIIDDVLSSASLGVNYLDLSLVKIPGLTQNKGAWLLNTDKNLAVEKNSPAELAGLKAGDIIIRVNNRELSSSLSLAQLISEFKPGANISITYLRGVEEKSLNLKLNELK